MPIKTAKPDTRTDRDHESIERLSRLALNRAQRVAALWQSPILPDSEVPEILRIPASTWQLKKKSADAPPIFSIGKRSYVCTAKLLAWCERLTYVPRHLSFPHANSQGRPGAIMQSAEGLMTNSHDTTIDLAMRARAGIERLLEILNWPSDDIALHRAIDRCLELEEKRPDANR